ncbi:hypothetical protein PPYR_05987 [Photinus pyralis]|uniref:Uncharacterized protein n=1 Tax=Photinus pyralis TaxID=7054 RepID=A0A5N4ASD4_PHOPY|nr:zinc finger protein 512B-like [Photinus pyralis]KAB0800247.1 hypothetical protein PPYR_05987 [Photinus pyralis]
MARSERWCLLLCLGIVIGLFTAGNCEEANEEKITNKRSVIHGDEYDAYGNKCWGSCLSTHTYGGHQGHAFSNVNGLYSGGHSDYVPDHGSHDHFPSINTHTHSVHTITKEVPVPKPYPVTVTKHVPVKIPQPYPVEVPKHVPFPVKVKVPVVVPKPYPVKITERVPYPVHKPVYVPVTKHVPVEIPKPYPVHITKHVPYEVKVPVEVPKPYPVRVTEHVPYPVEKKVYVKVSEPYPVKVPTPVYISEHNEDFIKDNANVHFSIGEDHSSIKDESYLDDCFHGNDFGHSKFSSYGSGGLKSGQVQSFSGESGTYTGVYIPSSEGGLNGRRW